MPSMRQLNLLIILNLLMPAFGFAQQTTTPAQQGPSLFELLAMPIGFLLIIYFFMIRPQQRKVKEHAQLLAALKPGEEVVTSGGIIGRVRSVSDTFVALEVGNNTVIKVMKNNVGGLAKPQPTKQKVKQQTAARPVKG